MISLGSQRGGRGHAHALLHAAAQLVGKHTRHTGIQPHMLQQELYLGAELALALVIAMVLQAVDDLVLDAHDRIERVHRCLRHQRNIVEAGQAHLFLVQLEQIATVEDDLALDDAARRPDQAHDGQGQRRLTTAGFADERQAFALLQRQGSRR